MENKKIKCEINSFEMAFEILGISKDHKFLIVKDENNRLNQLFCEYGEEYDVKYLESIFGDKIKEISIEEYTEKEAALNKSKEE